MGDQGKAHGSGEGGSALVIVLMMIAMLGVLTLTVATLSVNNLVGARRSQQAGVALNAADAGLAHGVEYLRSAGVGALAAGQPWTSSNRTTVTGTSDGTNTTPLVSGGATVSYEVYIEKISEWSASTPGLYRVHSVGKAGSSARREVIQDVTVSPAKFPMGLFGKSIQGGGGVINNQSVFSTGCVSKRSQIDFTGVDILHNNIQPGVHSSGVITEANGGCVKKANDNIHNDNICNTSGNHGQGYKYDQDSLGGPLAISSACQPVGHTSLIASERELATMFNLTIPMPLTPAQLERLKTIAISQGNYWTSSSYTTSSPVWSSAHPNVVMYFDLLKTSSVQEVNLNSIPKFDRASGLSASCSSQSLVIIVSGGDVQMNSNQNLAGSVFVLGDVQGGNVKKFNGNAQLIGTLYADNIDLKGTFNLDMDECFKANLSPALFDVEPSSYREIDR